MSEWVSALIGAGSAVVGGIATGWFTRNAGHRQAAAAEAAGQAQAAALISTVQATLDEQRHTRALEQRRQVYAGLLTSATEWQTEGSDSGYSRMVSALVLVELEGPSEVSDAALRFVGAVRERRSFNDDLRGFGELISTREAYITAVRRALDEA